MIRPAKKEDLHEIDRLGHLFNVEIQKNSPLNKLKSVKYAKPKRISSSAYAGHFSKENKLFVAVEDGLVVGFISGSVLRQKDKVIEKYGKIDDLYVEKKFRRSGMASGLVDAMLAWFKKKGSTHAVLFASPGKPVHEYYSRIGFDTVYHYMQKKL